MGGHEALGLHFSMLWQQWPFPWQLSIWLQQLLLSEPFQLPALQWWQAQHWKCAGSLVLKDAQSSRLCNAQKKYKKGTPCAKLIFPTKALSKAGFQQPNSISALPRLPNRANKRGLH